MTVDKEAIDYRESTHIYYHMNRMLMSSQKYVLF